ncbi:MAG: hypothetical protein ABSB73_11945 [Solirubrobacteraceae bacterium]|jgi:hypothetical protein
MHSQLSLALANARHQEFIDQAARRRPSLRAARREKAIAPQAFWEGLTLRLATACDRQALARLAELEQTQQPAEPVLLGVVMQRPVAAVSLSDGRVVADPFFATAELVELLRLRARQLRRR